MALPIEDIQDYPSLDHARWGQESPLLPISTSSVSRILSSGNYNPFAIPALTHPLYDAEIWNWEKWRIVYGGGDLFLREFLERFSRREKRIDFEKRRRITPVQAFATAAIDEICNSIFQRVGDTTRTGGSPTFQLAVNGKNGGVDLRGSNMNWFVGHYVLPELLVQKKVGIYVDAPQFGNTLAEKGHKHPFYIPYRAEDIRNWAFTSTDTGSEFSAVLLREYKYILDTQTSLPIREIECYRHVYLNDHGTVSIQFYDAAGAIEGDLFEINISRIPFEVPEITRSLMRDVANHQISLTNLGSSDISYILKSGYPLYTEQYDPKTENSYLKSATTAWRERFAPQNGETEQCNTPPEEPTQNINVGASEGRRYPIGMDRPEFIAPPKGPVEISMAKAENLKDEIRALVHLALASVQGRSASAESKKVDQQQGLESGLAAIGLELEKMESRLAEFWAMYEGQQPATVIYPKYWSIKSIAEVKSELESWEKVRDSVPSLTFKKEINKRIVEQVLGTRVPYETLVQIQKEIDDAKGGSSDPKTINTDVENGILSANTASTLRGYPDGEVDAAQKEHAARLASIAQAQSSGKALEKVAGKEAETQLQSENGITNPAARGVPDLSPNPAGDAAIEKVNKPGRGQAK